jgi:hypothetical protein
MPPKKLPADQHRPTTRYRYRDRTAEARKGHAEQSLAWRRAQTEAEFPASLRRELLKLIRQGMRVSEAAAQVGFTWQKVYGLAAIDEDFSDALDDATASACVCGGRPWLRVEGRRRCFCPDAREYRANEARAYRERQRQWSGA